MIEITGAHPRALGVHVQSFAVSARPSVRRGGAHGPLASELERAVGENQIRVVFQPIAATNSLRLAGAEALARWDNPTRGAIRPDVFIPLAERSGLISRLGEAVMRDACTHAASWDSSFGAGPPMLSVNVSGRQLVDREFPASVAGILDATGLRPTSLVLELTETALANRGPAISTMESLRDMGVRFVLDDLGTGYSSLASLCSLPLDGVKIDRCFVQALTSRRARAVVGAIIDVGCSLGLSVVAEGVETEEELACLRVLGCPHIQGFLVGRPLSAADFAALGRGASVAPTQRCTASAIA